MVGSAVETALFIDVVSICDWLVAQRSRATVSKAARNVAIVIESRDNQKEAVFGVGPGVLLGGWSLMVRVPTPLGGKWLGGEDERDIDVRHKLGACSHDGRLRPRFSAFRIRASFCFSGLPTLKVHRDMTHKALALPSAQRSALSARRSALSFFRSDIGTLRKSLPCKRNGIIHDTKPTHYTYLCPILPS